MKLKIPVSVQNSGQDKRTVASAASIKSVKKKSAKENSIIYVVKGGDTLSTIARRHKVSMDLIKKSNRMASNGRVLRGQKLVIPQSPGRDS